MYQVRAHPELQVLCQALSPDNPSLLPTFVTSSIPYIDTIGSPINKPSRLPHVVTSVDPSGDPIYLPSYVPSVNPSRPPNEQQVGSLLE